MNDTATDEDLVELFSLDNVDELIGIAVSMGGMMFHQTCNGQWVKNAAADKWTFRPDAEGEL